MQKEIKNNKKIHKITYLFQSQEYNKNLEIKQRRRNSRPTRNNKENHRKLSKKHIKLKKLAGIKTDSKNCEKNKDG